MDINKKIDIFFDETECPMCKSRVNTHFETLDIPHFGELLLFSLICHNCGYKKNDLFNVYEKEPKRHIFNFKDKSDLNVKVVKSGSCTIRIPEFGTIIEPGAEAEGYITNIEGIIYRIKDILISIEKDYDEEETLTNIQELKSKIKKTLEGSFNFTLILEDPSGNSTILSEDKSKLIIEDL